MSPDTAGGPRGEELRGLGVSPGIAIGRALVLQGPRAAVFHSRREGPEVEAEVVRFWRAVRGAWRQLRGLRDRVRREAGDPFARVFEVQILILRDRNLLQETAALIREERVNAEWAFRTVVRRYTQVFARLGDPDLRERGTDIEDVEARVQAILGGRRRGRDLSHLTSEVIVVGPTLSPSDVASLDRDHVIGLAMDGGGPTSHTAIIANALGIPAVTGLRDASRRVSTGERLVLDGASGLLVRDPSARELEQWADRRASRRQREVELAALRDLPAAMTDGARVGLMANIELRDEMEAARRYGAEGVGLYRSEFLHMGADDREPMEEDYFRVYREVAERALPHEVVVRTLDLGGEKLSAGEEARAEPNPVLGLRAIRLCLRRPDLFRRQLRAILRAAAHGKVRLLVPMVSGLEEIRQTRAILESVRDELSEQRVPHDPDVPVGVLVETPAAALIVERLCREVDFFAIGTNDLIQYTLAIDRGNEAVSYLYQPFHPAILGLLRDVAEIAGRYGVRVSVCGEMAADPMAAVVLAGLGIAELSMKPAAIPGVKEVIRSMSLRDARSIAQDALRCDTAGEAEEMVRRRVLSFMPAEYACPL
ncbi:MAG: phosphoenolpyruvate--protein phosphotransferase [Acidobacteriota bacterium]